MQDYPRSSLLSVLFLLLPSPPPHLPVPFHSQCVHPVSRDRPCCPGPAPGGSGPCQLSHALPRRPAPGHPPSCSLHVQADQVGVCRWPAVRWSAEHDLRSTLPAQCQPFCADDMWGGGANETCCGEESHLCCPLWFNAVTMLGQLLLAGVGTQLEHVVCTYVHTHGCSVYVHGCVCLRVQVGDV